VAVSPAEELSPSEQVLVQRARELRLLSAGTAVTGSW
jgi:hypothetical protein